MSQAAHEIRSIWPYRSAETSKIPTARRAAVSQRGIGLRAPTSFPVLVCEGPHAAHCLAAELSATGIVIERGRDLSEREQKALLKLELFLPNEQRPVRVLARIARRARPGVYGLKFVLISDVDRLTLMEHLDRERERERLLSLELLEEVESSMRH